MNELQRRLRKIRACLEAVEKAGKFRTDGEAWRGWPHGGDLVWLLATLWLPKKRLLAVLDAMVRQAQEWAEAAEGKERVAEAESAFLAAAAENEAEAVRARAEWAENEAEAFWAGIDAGREAYWAAYYAAEAAERAGLMTYWEAQAVLADLVRREVPWEGVKELWEKTWAVEGNRR